MLYPEGKIYYWEEKVMTENDKKLEALFNELVPRRGKADSLAGEILRAAGRLGYRWSNDGDQIGIGYGKETCNAAARFLLIYGNKDIQVLVTALWGLSDYGKYSAVLDQLIGKIVDYINDNPDLRTMSTEDMFAYFFREYDVEDD